MGSKEPKIEMLTIMEVWQLVLVGIYKTVLNLIFWVCDHVLKIAIFEAISFIDKSCLWGRGVKPWFGLIGQEVFWI